MKMRRMFAALLALAMLLSVLPVVGLGVTTNDVDTKGKVTGPYDNSELYLGKTATLENDGTYTIRLEAFATGNPVVTQLRSGLPLDIILVLDQSGSMFQNNYLETLRESVDEFIDVIAANGRSIGVTHRVGIVGFASDVDDGSSGEGSSIAGGSDNRYTNTGVFLEDGTFKNYGDAATSYVEVSDPVVGGTYYIRDSNRKYQKLTSGEGYAIVPNPSTERDDLYAKVGNSYLLADYFNDAYYPVTNLDASKTYFVDVNGTKMPITATTETTYNYTRVTRTNDRDGQTYYISRSSANGTDFIQITCTDEGWFLQSDYVWRDEDGNEYTRGNNGQFTRNGTTYYAYNRSETTVTTWTLTDGTVINPTAQTVYDHLSGWVYYQNGAYYSYNGDLYEKGTTWTYSGTTYDPATTQFFAQATTGGLTDDDYRDALMPVTNGAAGAGSITAALDIAVSKIASSGATRPSLGMEMAKNILDNRSSLDDDDKRQTVVVVFTDGSPGYSAFEEAEANAALKISAELKAEDGHNATVYSIGLYPEKSDNNIVSVFMTGLSSACPTAESIDDIAGSTYTKENVTLSNLMELTETWTVVEEYYYLRNSVYYPVKARINSGTVQAQYVNGSSSTNLTVTNGKIDLYKRTFDTYESGSKYYLYASNKEVLYDIFPEIVTDSTTTTLDKEYLTTDTLLRDILQTGFVFTNGTTVTMSSLAGTWGADKKITWAAAETVIDSVTVTDSAAQTTTSASGKLSVYNQGGYQFVEAKGFDFDNAYFSEGGHENGAKLIVTITRVEATDLVAWNQTDLTNNPYSGVWSPVLEDGTRTQIGVFPQPNTYFSNAVVVMDYAKTTEDLKDLIRQSGVKHLDADGMNYFASADTDITDAYGSAAINGGALTYTPNTMQWDGADAFYVFGNTADATILRHSANKVYGNVWSKVTAIPANNVYYEDTFVTSESTGTVGIDFTGTWQQVSAGMNTETPEAGENAENGGVHGWEDSLADDTGYSDGTAAEGGDQATATFTFTGTGVDIYSRTNMQTGRVMVSLYAGAAATGVPLRTLVVDNFAHSGDYYMIPTLSIHEIPYRVSGKTQIDENGNIIYEAMPYGTYTVKLKVLAVTDDADRDGTVTTRSTYYLDGIRVYNPAANNGAVKDAYGDDEINASFAEVRDILLDANTFDAESENGVGGPVFIDQIVHKGEDGAISDSVGVSSSDIAVYESVGPENEVYLQKDQSIAFAPIAGAKYYVGLKSPTGEPVTVFIYKDGGIEEITISHTTDMFYEVTPEEGIVFIGNMSENANLLAITKIKVIKQDTVLMKAMFRSVSREEILAAADEAYAAAADPVMPEIEIVNPGIDEPANSTAEQLRELIKRLFGNLWDWFR